MCAVSLWNLDLRAYGQGQVELLTGTEGVPVANASSVLPSFSRPRLQVLA